MEYVNLGSTGLKVSRLCLGCMTYGSPKWRDWVLDYEQAKRLMKRPVVIDARNLYEPARMREHGFTYDSIGRP